MSRSRSRSDSLVMEALLHTLRNLTPLAQGLCLLLLAIYAASGLRFVAPNQTALVLRLGKLQPETHGPGLLLTWPQPVDEVVLLDTGNEHSLPLDAWTPLGRRIENAGTPRQFTAAEVQAALAENGNAPLPTDIATAGDSLDPVTDGYSVTGDLNILQGRFALRYRITDPVAFFRHSPDQAAAQLRNLSYRAAAHALSARMIDRCLTDQRESLASTIRAQISKDAAALHLGVTPTAFDLRELVPPKQVAASFEDVTSARLAARTLVENAGEYRLKQLAITTGQAATIKQRAAAASSQLVAAAEGESAAFRRFYAEYRKTPDLVRSRLYTDTMNTVMQQVNSSTLLPPGASASTVILEPSPTVPR